MGNNKNNIFLWGIKNEKPLTYKIYKHLKKNALGYEKRVKSSVLMKEFNINSNKELRKHIEIIRNNDIFQKIICSESGNNGGYWIATNQEEVYMTLRHLYKRSMQMLKTYSKIRNKSNLNNQYRLKLSEYEKNIYESIMVSANEEN